MQIISENDPNWIQTYTEIYNKEIASGTNPQQAAGSIAETATVSPNAAGSIAPGAGPAIVNEQGYMQPVTGKMMHEGHGRTSY